MSYEGYEQHICENGHRFDTSPSMWFDDDDVPRCPQCMAKSVFCNCVDDTNGEEYGVILETGWNKLELRPMVTEICNLGHQHTVEGATYRVPTEDELKELRYFRHYDKQEFLPLSSYDKYMEELYVKESD